MHLSRNNAIFLTAHLSQAYFGSRTNPKTFASIYSMILPHRLTCLLRKIKASKCSESFEEIFTCLINYFNTVVRKIIPSLRHWFRRGKFSNSVVDRKNFFHAYMEGGVTANTIYFLEQVVGSEGTIKLTRWFKMAKVGEWTSSLTSTAPLAYHQFLWPPCSTIHSCKWLRLGKFTTEGLSQPCQLLTIISRWKLHRNHKWSEIINGKSLRKNTYDFLCNC